MKCGYIRVSSQTQNTARQDILMEQLGVDKVYIDKISGKNTDRPQLQAMLTELERGDTVIVESISRFARNTKDLLELADRLNEKGVEFISKKEGFDTQTPAGRLMLTMFGAIAELERSYILDRSKEGIAIKKANGGYIGENHKGRVRAHVDPIRFESLYQQFSAKSITIGQAAESMSLTEHTLRRRFNERKAAGESYNPNAMQ